MPHPTPVRVVSAGPPGPAADLEAAVAGAARRWLPATAGFLRRAGAAVVEPETIDVHLREGRGPAWTRGHQITLYRRSAAEDTVAPLAHELVHVLAPRSAVPALDEGLAVLADSRLGLAGPVWPFYHLAPDRWVAGFVEDGTALSLASLLAPARSPASDPDGWPRLHRFYLEAASLVGFLLATDRAGFWRRFVAPEPDLRLEAGTEAAWLARVGPGLSPAERELRERSLAEQRQTWLRIRGDAVAVAVRP